MNKKILVLMVMMLLVLNTASAYTYSGYTSPFNPTGNSSVTVNADKTLNINGRTLFPQIMGTVCDVYSMIESQCLSNLNKMKNYTADSPGSGFGSKFNRLYDPLPYYASAKIGVIPLAYYHYPVTSSYLFGYYSRYDEPDISLYNTVKADYDLIKSKDPNHIVILGHWVRGKDWENAADVIIYGLYPYKTSIINHPNPREKIQYVYEHMVKSNILLGYNNFDETKKPFWPVLQALSGPDDAGVLPTTKSETKALMYNAITMNVKGFGYWSYSFSGIGATGGLMYNQTKVDEHITLSDEINYLSDILVLPTKDYSWYFRQGNNVTFSKNLTYILKGEDAAHTVTYDMYNVTNFNYMLKQNGNTYYLIVLNKDDRAISNVNITISGLTGTMTATILGLATAGSNPGRILPVNNGTFADSFAGLEPIVYEITNSGSAPAISSWGNTKTNNATTSFSMSNSEPVTFNVTANQAITTWTWLKDDVQTGKTTGSYSTSWDSTGTKTIKVYGTNANGSTSPTTWTITVNSLNSTKFGVGGAAWDSAGTSSNVYIEDSKIKLGFWGENFDDGLYDWTTEEGNIAVANQKLTMYGSGNAHVSKIIGNHSDVAMFATWTETRYDGFKSFAIRSDTSRSNPDMNYWVSGRPTGTGLWIVKYNGTDWVNVNGTGTFTRTNGSTSYCVVKAYGSTFKVYCSNASYADALASSPVSQGTDSAYTYGNRIRLEGSFARSSDIVTFDNLRMIPTDASGNLINSGSKTVYYDAGANNQTNGFIINATTPANTNYTVSYRQKYTGSWIPIGGTYTGNQTLSITGTKYQDTEISITLFGNGTSFPDIETIEFIREQAAASNVYPRYDVDENGIVDMDDMTLVGQHFNEIVSIPFPRYDVNMDELVNIDDITIVGQHYGEKF